MPVDVSLNDRKITILGAIIKVYLGTGELIGSRIVSKYSDLKLDFAIIRSEMSNLEDMGYIVQPHTSTGHIPSDKRYWFCVGQIMRDKKNEVAGFENMMVQKADRLELVLRKMAQVLASNANHAAMTSDPSYHKTKLKFIRLSRMEEDKLLAVVVVEGNIIRNIIVDTTEDLSDDEVLNLNILLNNSLSGSTIEEINLDIVNRLKDDTGIHSQIVDLVLSEVTKAVRTGEEDLQIYTNGATNIFKHPGFSEGDKASRLIGTLEYKEVFQEFASGINAESESDSDIWVYTGDESPVQSMKDCSVVTVNYDLGGGLRGTAGIIGPKRMDYEKVLETLRSLMNQLGVALKKDER